MLAVVGAQFVADVLDALAARIAEVLPADMVEGVKRLLAVGAKGGRPWVGPMGGGDES